MFGYDPEQVMELMWIAHSCKEVHLLEQMSKLIYYHSIAVS